MAASFQTKVKTWVLECFGKVIADDKEEHNHRFLEEALELVQAGGCSKDAALNLVHYVYNRPVGELKQEVGGVMVTLAAFCTAHQITMVKAADAELLRCWQNIARIRAKQAAKPKHSALPE